MKLAPTLAAFAAVAACSGLEARHDAEPAPPPESAAPGATAAAHDPSSEAAENTKTESPPADEPSEPALEEAVAEEPESLDETTPPPPPSKPAGRAAKKGDSFGGLHGVGSGGGGVGYGRGSAGVAMKAARVATAPVVSPRGETMPEPKDREAYDPIEEDSFESPLDKPLSTFSIDVDTASYSNVRRILREGRLPPKDAVRVEEFVNYFRYDYDPPAGSDPFATDVHVTSCPWEPKHRLVRIGLKGRDIDRESRPPANLVFLLDVSGSMDEPMKLPLLKSAFKMLVENLRRDDSVAIAVYAGAAGLVLPPTSGARKDLILDALDRLEAGGSTNGGDGLLLAYKVAEDAFLQGGVNRVVWATDGDFNVGASSKGELVRLVEEKRKGGVFLTVLGFGSGNLQDDRLEAISGKGNGTYAYVDSLREAKKVLVEEAGGTLVTIAKDVKIQVEWNPAHVAGYRLIGYENRRLAARDFHDDRKDAGEIGAGHTVTALYEVIPAGVPVPGPAVDRLKYQAPPEVTGKASPEMLTVKLRFKAPDGDVSKLLAFPAVDEGTRLHQSPPDVRFAAAVTTFGLMLRDSAHKGGASWDLAVELAEESAGADPDGHRAEMVELVREAKRLASNR